MATLTHPSLTNSQLSPLAVRPWGNWFTHAIATLRLWHRRSAERRALARLNHRELADFGATTADVYRELHTPFWRSLPPC